MTIDSPLATLAVAAGIGLLLGAERERRKGRGPGRGAAGVRTFALVSLLGGVSLRAGGGPALVVAGAFVGLAALASYAFRGDDDPGLTTEVALVLAFMLGALAQRDAPLAASLGVGVTILLAARRRLHELVRDVLSERELRDGLLFAAAAIVVLPLVPDRDLGPYGALNPFTIWRLVVIVMAISGAGYIGMRVLGPRFGLPVTGLAAGFVSSTLAIASLGARAAQAPSLLRPAIAGAVLSALASLGHNAIVVGATSSSALLALAVPLTAGGAAAGAIGAVAARRAAREPAPDQEPPGRAFDLKTAVSFALLLTGALLLSFALADRLGGSGFVLAAALTGLADSSAATASAAALVATGRMTPSEAVVPVLVALTANTLTRLVVAFLAGRRRFALALAPALLAVPAGCWVGVAILAAAT